MKNIIPFAISRLTKAHHFTFLKEFLTLLEQANFSEPKLRDATEELKTCFEEEDRYFQLSREARQTQQIKAADHGRDTYYRKLCRLARVWLDTPFEKAAAAEKVMKALRNFRSMTSENYRAESGLADKVIAILTQKDLIQAVDLIGGKELLDLMITYNEEVQTLMRKRTEESVKVPKQALQNARTRNDAIYTRLVALIEGYSATADEPEVFDTFIDRWNGHIEAFRTQLKRSATLRAKAEKADKAEKAEDEGPTS